MFLQQQPAFLIYHWKSTRVCVCMLVGSTETETHEKKKKKTKKKSTHEMPFCAEHFSFVWKVAIWVCMCVACQNVYRRSVCAAHVKSKRRHESASKDWYLFRIDGCEWFVYRPGIQVVVVVTTLNNNERARKRQWKQLIRANANSHSRDNNNKEKNKWK